MVFMNHTRIFVSQSRSSGMERYETVKNMRRTEEYAGDRERKRMEYEDSRMIHEDHSAVANLPQNVMMKPWPKSVYATYHLDDTISGIDYQMWEDSDMKKSNKYKRSRFPEKY